MSIFCSGPWLSPSAGWYPSCGFLSSVENGKRSAIDNPEKHEQQEPEPLDNPSRKLRELSDKAVSLLRSVQFRKDVVEERLKHCSKGGQSAGGLSDEVQVLARCLSDQFTQLETTIDDLHDDIMISLMSRRNEATVDWDDLEVGIKAFELQLTAGSHISARIFGMPELEFDACEPERERKERAYYRRLALWEADMKEWQFGQALLERRVKCLKYQKIYKWKRREARKRRGAHQAERWHLYIKMMDWKRRSQNAFDKWQKWEPRQTWLKRTRDEPPPSWPRRDPDEPARSLERARPLSWAALFH